jgi:hypothetical protein
MSRHEGVLLTVRPRRIRIYAIVAATVVVVAMIVVGLLLQHSDDGVNFGVADQVGLIGIGLLLGAAILAMARPRLEVTADGLWVRNVIGERFFAWNLVYRIAFPEGANWAQLTLPDDESHPVMAVQALDKQRAVASLKAARALHAQYAPPAPQPSPEYARELLRRERDRPLGRLEKIDRIKAGHDGGQTD